MRSIAHTIENGLRRFYQIAQRIAPTSVTSAFGYRDCRRFTWRSDGNPGRRIPRHCHKTRTTIADDVPSRQRLLCAQQHRSIVTRAMTSWHDSGNAAPVNSEPFGS
jgi:hypothetical protein